MKILPWLLPLIDEGKEVKRPVKVSPPARMKGWSYLGEHQENKLGSQQEGEQSTAARSHIKHTHC